MSGRPVHFDLTAEDPERLVTFYYKTFGWACTKWEGPNEYWMFDTGSDTPGINGGIWRRDTIVDGPATINTINVASIDETIDAIGSAGGTVTMGKHDVPGVGTFAMATDTEGNQFVVMQFDRPMA
jgi:predicted enzyme related to lactoylglutathione lyase